MYKDARFSRRPLSHVLDDIDAFAAAVVSLKAGEGHVGGPYEPPVTEAALSAVWNWYADGMRSIFLQDADPLMMSADDLKAILTRLLEYFPGTQRITTYARSRSLAKMSVDELSTLRVAGLDRIHVGFESGSDTVLAFMDKGVSKATHVEAGRKVKAAGMELSAYYMPGLGGRETWQEHALETADLMNQVDPDFIRLRTLAVPEHVPLAADVAAGAFIKAGDVENAREIVLFLESLTDIRSTVVSDHILNISQDIRGKLPEDRVRMLGELLTFLDLDEHEQVLYRIGRRRGMFAGTTDLGDPAARARAERFCRELGATPENVDGITDELVKRFV